MESGGDGYLFGLLVFGGWVVWRSIRKSRQPEHLLKKRVAERVKVREGDPESEQAICDYLNKQYSKDPNFPGTDFDFAYNPKVDRYVCKKTRVVHIADTLI